VNVVTVKDGKLVTPGGMSYQVLALDENAKYMSLPVLRKIRALVKAGAIITGIKPERTPSLSDNQAEFKSIATEVWNGNHKNVFTNRPIEQALAAKKNQADFTHAKPQIDSEVLYVHRALPECEIYWLNNRKDRLEIIETSFRVSGKVQEIWRPESGKIQKVSFQVKDGRTIVPLRLEPNVTNKITYATMPFFQEDSPLLPSGLLGPMQVWEKKSKHEQNQTSDSRFRNIKGRM